MPHGVEEFLVGDGAIKPVALVDPILHDLHHLVVLIPGLGYRHHQLVDEVSFPQTVDSLNAVQTSLKPGATGFLGANDEENLHALLEREHHPAVDSLMIQVVGCTNRC